ncbi:DUF4231 domain-containing protein [Pinibacter aurantiacus]|uniref:DUF4231 domain-containing protein n=1 Tax=Pinibacter aurantiacus TaxID=2851599 RepID=A0A9E2W9U8_9BACT|nr:DUF4231 domain-containing protein [Pinibacter aurantiacus]MBV4360257.1 DUF4231 domain-containing protein [Pinibacter aurantiacus]
MASTIRPISEQDFTGLYIASDKASKNAQKSYVTVVATVLALTIFASALAIYNYQCAYSKRLLYTISGISLLISMLLTIILLTKKFEDFWYQGRALAESCKTLSWRFMTCSELFENTVPLATAKQRFTNRIDDLGKEFTELNKAMSADLINNAVITQLMLDIRSLSLNDRIKYYIRNRIEDQKLWYSQKASFNLKKYNLWFFLIIATQGLSLASVVFLISNPDSNWNFVGFFTTVSAAFLSWLQLKRHQELKQAYTTASQELNIIASLADDISSEQEFSKFVLDSENAISREHTLWLAQRRK